MEALDIYDTGKPSSIIHRFGRLSAPFIALTWGSERFYEARVVEDATKTRGVTKLTLTRPLHIGDVIYPINRPDLEFVIKKKTDWGRNKYSFDIVLLNRNNIVSLHLDELKKGKLIKLKGQVGSRKR